jgi:transcriptional regulator with GAF, ATPase, and Fis domain
VKTNRLAPERTPQVYWKAPVNGDEDAPRDFRELRAEAERRIVLETLARNDGHGPRAAEELGLADHASLLKSMRRLGLNRN